MSIRSDGTGYLELPAKVVGSYPFSLMVWVSENATDVDSSWMGQGQSDGPNNCYMYHMGSTANTRAATVFGAGAVYEATRSVNPVPSTTMRLAVAVFASASSRSIYFSDNTAYTNTGIATDLINAQNRLVIGASHYNGVAASAITNGSFAEAHVFNVALTASDVANLLADTVKPEAIAGWVDGWMLRNAADLTSIGGTRTLTVVGNISDTGAAAHPITRIGPTVNLAIANLASASTLSTVAVTVTPAVAGVVNLAISNLASVSTLSTIAVANTPVQGTITSDVFTAYGSPAPLSALTVPNVTVTRMADRVQVLSLANQVTNGAGRLVLTSASIVAGVWYMLASWNADGTLRGFKAHLAA